MIKILVVVYEPDKVASIMHDVWKDRYILTIVSDGLAAWNLIRVVPPDILFVEDIIPGMDGYELLGKVYQEAQLLTVKTVFAMRLNNDGIPNRDWEYPVDNYLIRPYSPWQAVLSVEQLMYRMITLNEQGIEKWTAYKRLVQSQSHI